MCGYKTMRRRDGRSGQPRRPRVLYSATSQNSNGTTTRQGGELLRPVARGQQSLRMAGFTLGELLVSVAVLILVVLLATHLLNSAATVTSLGHKQMDVDSQARQLLDRTAIDFAQMVKRSDVDYYLKSSWFVTGSPISAPGCTAACASVYGMGVRTVKQLGNDTIAFYSTVPGYYPSGGSQSPVSLVAYRINAQNKLERMGKGLLWNGATPTSGATPPAVVFMPIPLASLLPIAELPSPTPDPTSTPAWPEIAIGAGSAWSDSEVIGPQVFRFEYYYLLKGQTDPTSGITYSPILSDTPWDTRICACPAAPLPSATPTSTPAPTATPAGTPIATPTPPSLCCHVAPEGMQDVAAVVVVIAVIDPKSKVLLSDATNPPQIAQVASQLIDWGTTSCPGCPTQTQWQTTPGLLRAQWQSALNGITSLPRPAISGIRVYERYFYLSPPTLLTP
jgi:hypothetical protein